MTKHIPTRLGENMAGRRQLSARYKAERNVIAARYAEWELCGPPETRADEGAAFSPWGHD